MFSVLTHSAQPGTSEVSTFARAAIAMMGAPMRIGRAVLTAFGIVLVASGQSAVGQVSSPASNWLTYKGPNFSFGYPSFMNCCTTADDGTLLVGVYSGGKPQFAVDFLPGFRNRESIALQCSALDELLRSRANDVRQNYEQANQGNRSEWYKVSTTFEGPAPGPFEGRIITISIVRGNGPGVEVSSFGVWIIGTLRDRGAYLTYGFTAAGQKDAWNVYKEFASRVRMPGARIPRGSMCSY